MKKQIGLGARMFISFFSVMMIILLLIWSAFSLFAGNYIRNMALSALTQTADRLVEGGPLLVEPSLSYDQLLENVYLVIQERATIAEVNVAIVDVDYNILLPNEGDMLSFDYAQLVDALIAVKEQQGPPATLQNVHIWNNEYSYYLASLPIVPVEAGMAHGEQYLLLFVDVTKMNALSSQLNVMLVPIALIALLIAGIMTAFITNSIAKPVKELSEFAADIGKGEFTTRELETGARELTELLDSMNETVKRLDSYDREQRAFFQNVSHELRTPLMSIKGYAEGIKYGVFDDNGEAADIIMSESNRLSDMVEGLLYISRMDNREQKLDCDWCDLRELVTSSVEALKGITVSSGKEIDFSFPAVAVTAWCDEGHLSRAVTNLISNALRYAQHRILIEAGGDDNHVFIAVSDDGPGIAPEALPRLFDRFYKGSGGKHGIGLSIAKSIVDQHGGRILARNNDKGATFSIILPRHPRSDPQSQNTN